MRVIEAVIVRARRDMDNATPALRMLRTTRADVRAEGAKALIARARGASKSSIGGILSQGMRRARPIKFFNKRSLFS
ncbi:MAG: hypothetical protein GC162_16815 [Planctomycetes bacterium]|nr:hypothetical protein [Planctomycetota bacterium]